MWLKVSTLRIKCIIYDTNIVSDEIRQTKNDFSIRTDEIERNGIYLKIVMIES